MINYAYVIGKNGDAHFTVPQFDFYFKVAIPKANKERLITARDKFGRILSSKCHKLIYN